MSAAVVACATVMAIAAVALPAGSAPAPEVSAPEVSAPEVSAQEVSARRQEPITPIPVRTISAAKAQLGAALFRDTRLSGNGRIACVSCHDLASNGAGASPAAASTNGHGRLRNTPTVFNATLNFRLDWDGYFRSLEAQADGTLRNPSIMGTTPDAAAARLRADPAMVAAFRKTYGGPPDGKRLVAAISTYERALVTPGSRFDAWLLGDDRALTDTELRGYRTFKVLGCIACHQGVNVGGNLYQRAGVFHPLGRIPALRTRVPSLRNVATTAPYFHDGSAGDLPTAVRAMGRAQLDRTLTEQEIQDITAFLGTLTGRRDGRAVTAPR